MVRRSAMLLLTLSLPVLVLPVEASATRKRADFNGDGVGDVAAGVPRDEIAGMDNAGAVNVLYGTRRGVRARGNGYFRQGPPGGAVPDASEAGDNFGNAVTAGDFNGDGYDDMAVGVRQEEIFGQPIAGVVHVFMGTRRGLTTRGSQIWHQNRPGMKDEVESFEEFGNAVAAGDFNGDGYDDLAVGVSREDVAGLVDAGAVHVLYGTRRGLRARGNHLLHQNTGSMKDVAETNDHFGGVLEVGDFDGDGRDDLAVGIPSEERGALDRSGAVQVIYGTRRGLRTRGNQFWSQDTPGMKDMAESDDHFGVDLAVGNFGKSGHDDLAIGVDGETIGGNVGAGAVHVIYGTRRGLRARGNQFWHQDRPGVKGVTAFSDLFGRGLAAGNFGRSGHDDLAIGIQGEDPGGVSGAGAVHVLYGARGGLTSNGDQIWHLGKSGMKGALQDSSFFGLVLGAGDVGRGRWSDLFVNSPFRNVGGVPNAGTVHVIYGTRRGLRAKGNQMWHQDRPRVKGVAAPQDEFGRGLI